MPPDRAPRTVRHDQPTGADRPGRRHRSESPAPLGGARLPAPGSLARRDVEILQQAAGNHAIARLVTGTTGPDLLVQRNGPDQVDAKNYGTFNTGSATYQLVEGGCKIHVSFSPGADMPHGTRVSFIQAIRTTSTSKGGKVSSAAAMPGQATDDSHARIDQFLGNPSAYYLDYIDESLLQLANWAKMSPDKLGFDVRSYAEYQQMAMEAITQNQFDTFWVKYDQGKLADLMKVQTDTGQPGIEQSEGQRAEKGTGLFGFLWDLFASDTDAKLYDEPKHNILKPTQDGEKATCLFHTAAVTKRTQGAAKVWDVIEWGYTVERKDGDDQWALVPIRHVELARSMMKGALEAMIASTPAYSGPTSLVDPDN